MRIGRSPGVGAGYVPFEAPSSARKRREPPSTPVTVVRSPAAVADSTRAAMEGRRKPLDRLFVVVTAALATPLRALGAALAWLVAHTVSALGEFVGLLLTGNPTARALCRALAASVGGIMCGVLEMPAAALSAALGMLKALVTVSNWRSVVQAMLQPLTSVGSIALLPLYRGLKRMDDVLFPPRPLTEHERAAATAAGFTQLERVRVHEGGLVLALFLGQATAQTHGDDFYVRPGSDGWLVHELVHRVQYEEAGGFAPFLAGYFAAYLAHRIGRDAYEAYRVMPQEAEAFCLSGGGCRCCNTLSHR